jgi:hypothetical protein
VTTAWPWLLNGATDTAEHATIAGRIRVVDRRFKNDRGWWAWRGISDFSAIAYVLNGQESELVQRLDAYAAAGRTIVRIFGNIGGALPNVNYLMPGYWEALEHTASLVNARGMYVSLCCYGAAEVFHDDDQYAETARRYAQFAAAHPGVVIRLANEPYKNGWENCDDPRLLALADLTASVLGHRDFAIGDPNDEALAPLQISAEHCNIAMLHPSRTEASDRWRRWVDHLKEGADLLPQLRTGVALVFDEPMGAGVRAAARRDDDPDAHMAAQVVATLTGCGYTYHWIPEEHAFTAAALPGLASFGVLAPALPVSPDWGFSNSIPVDSIAWSGLPGKTRNMLRGTEAWSVAYGEPDWNSLTWNDGWSATERYAASRVRVFALVK